MIVVPNLATTESTWPGLTGLLDTHSDLDHGRAVLTVGGQTEICLDASVAVADRAFEHLDLGRHEGEHPKFGVLDVLPVVPYGSSESEAQELADALATHIESRGVPVHRYGRADPEHRSLAEVRRYLRNEAHATHATAGVVCLGIRDPLIAFNVNFIGEPSTARDVASCVRTREIRALGFELASRSLVQVSMNLIAPDRVGPKAAFHRVVPLARDRGLDLVDCEVVGLVPHPILQELEGLPLRRPVRSIEQALAEKGLG